jgi:hypothetical protein
MLYTNVVDLRIVVEVPSSIISNSRWVLILIKVESTIQFQALFSGLVIDMEHCGCFAGALGYMSPRHEVLGFSEPENVWV